MWEVFTTPEHLAAFWGGDHATVPPDSVTVDLRVGGTFELETRGADGSSHPLCFRYEIIDAPTRLVLAEPRTGITTEIRLQPSGQRHDGGGPPAAVAARTADRAGSHRIGRDPRSTRRRRGRADQRPTEKNHMNTQRADRPPLHGRLQAQRPRRDPRRVSPTTSSGTSTAYAPRTGRPSSTTRSRTPHSRAAPSSPSNEPSTPATSSLSRARAADSTASTGASGSPTATCSPSGDDLIAQVDSYVVPLA